MRRVYITEWQAPTVAVIRRAHIFWGQGRQGWSAERMSLSTCLGLLPSPPSTAQNTLLLCQLVPWAALLASGMAFSPMPCPFSYLFSVLSCLRLQAIPEPYPGDIVKCPPPTTLYSGHIKKQTPYSSQMPASLEGFSQYLLKNNNNNRAMELEESKYFFKAIKLFHTSQIVNE